MSISYFISVVYNNKMNFIFNLTLYNVLLQLNLLIKYKLQNIKYYFSVLIRLLI